MKFFQFVFLAALSSSVASAINYEGVSLKPIRLILPPLSNNASIATTLAESACFHYLGDQVTLEWQHATLTT